MAGSWLACKSFYDRSNCKLYSNDGKLIISNEADDKSKYFRVPIIFTSRRAGYWPLGEGGRLMTNDWVYDKYDDVTCPG